MTDTTDLWKRELLLYNTWKEGSFVKVCLRLTTFRIDDFLNHFVSFLDKIHFVVFFLGFFFGLFFFFFACLTFSL